MKAHACSSTIQEYQELKVILGYTGNLRLTCSTWHLLSKKQTSKQNMRKFRIGGTKTSSYISIVLRQGVAVGIDMAPTDPQGEPL